MDHGFEGPRPYPPHGTLPWSTGIPSGARAGAAHHGWAAPGEKCKFKRPKRDFIIKKFDLKLPILSGNGGLMTTNNVNNSVLWGIKVKLFSLTFIHSNPQI